MTDKNPVKKNKDPLSPEARERQRQGIRDWHANKDKPTSAGSIKESRLLNNVRRKITDLTHPSSEIIRKAVTGGLVKRSEVWTGSDAQKDIESTDPSAYREMMELEPAVYDEDDNLVKAALEVRVLVTYVPVSKDKIEIAKWVITQDIALKKAAEESKLRKLEAAMKHKKAQDEGVIPKEDPQQAARDAAAKGEHLRPLASLEDVDEFPEEDEFQDEDDL